MGPRGSPTGHRLAALRNLAKAWLLFLVPTGGLGYLGWTLGGYHLALLFGGSVFMVAAVLYWYADRIGMGMVGAKPLLLVEAPALHSAVERLAARARVVKPKIYVIRDGYPRALSAGRGAQGGSALAFSTGLLGMASPAELDGIVAHELAHLRDRDVLVQTMVVTVASALVEVSRLAGWFQRAFLAVLAPIAASLLHLVLSPRREYRADRFAAELCDSPHGLADALQRLELAMDLVQFSASPVTEPLHTVNPFAEEGLARMFVTHPPIADRVRRLRALDPEWHERQDSA